jgi:hypothetical protein
MKFMTPGEAETKRQKAVEFLHRIGNDDLAEEFEDMSSADYAEHKGAQLMENPARKGSMPKTKSKAELESELGEANEYIEELEGKLNDIVGIAADDEDEEADEDEDDSTDEDDAEDTGDDEDEGDDEGE